MAVILMCIFNEEVLLNLPLCCFATLHEGKEEFFNAESLGWASSKLAI